MLTTILKEKKEFDTKSIQVVPGFDFNQKDVLNRIYLYYNSKYESGDIDDQGDKKYFYNINKNPCHIGTKAIDFDTKHIKILTAGGGTALKTWFFERDLKFWMKDQGFGKVLNRIFQELPIFGSVVLKVIDGKPYFADLRNLIVEQPADSLDKANYIIEIHNYTPIEFRRIGKEKKWDKVEEALSAFRGLGEPYITVYERYGEVEEIDEAGNKTYTFKRTVVGDVGKDVYDQYTQKITPRTGFILQEEEIDELPYWEFHWEKLPGRWLGIGRVEILFDPQIRTNEISNQQVKSSYWSTLRLWQSRDEGVNKNLLTDVENGQIIFSDSTINQIDMADRNLAYYNQEIQRWLQNRDEMTFSTDVGRGERLPAGTPLGSARLAAAMAASYFDQIRENVAMDIKKMLYEVIIPQFEKENSKEHILRLAGEDLEKINKLISEVLTKRKVISFIARNKRYPEAGEMRLLKSIVVERTKGKKERIVQIPADFYKDIKFKIDIDITGESMDTGVRSANKWMALQAVTADPTLLTDPTKRKFFGSWLEDGGLHLVDFEAEVAQPDMAGVVSQEVGRTGGGISRPVVPSAPARGEAEITL